MSESVDPSSSSSTPKVPFTFKRKSRPQASRKRTPSPDPTAETIIESSVVRPEQRTALNPLLQGTKRIREARKREREIDEQYKADESFILGGDELATRSSEWDLNNDASGSSEKATKRPRIDEDGNIITTNNQYLGKSGGYTDFIKKDERMSQMSSKLKAGPQKASANIRSITVMDYQPDVCKDYKGE
jgi:RING finger protein 113A